MSNFTLAIMWGAKVPPASVRDVLTTLGTRVAPARVDAFRVWLGEDEANLEVDLVGLTYPRAEIAALTREVSEAGGRLVESWRLPRDAREAFRARSLRGAELKATNDGEEAADWVCSHLQRIAPPEPRPTTDPALPGARPLARLRLERRVQTPVELPAVGARGTPEQRRARRFDVQLEVAFRTELEFVEEHATNISQGGLYLRTTNPPAEDTVVRVEVTLPTGERISGEAVVVHVRWQEAEAGIGLAFLNEDPAFAASLDRYLARLGATTASPVTRAASGPLDVRAVPQVQPLCGRTKTQT